MHTVADFIVTEKHIFFLCVNLIIREQQRVYDTLLPLLALLNKEPFTKVQSTFTRLTHTKSTCTVADHCITTAALT